MLDQSRYETIRIDRKDDGVVVATLNRPERLNAVNGRMHTELSTIARDFDDDHASKVLVITAVTFQVAPPPARPLRAAT